VPVTTVRRTTVFGRVRHAARWVAAGSVALSLTVAAAPAQAASPATSHLRSAVAPATVLIGASTVVSGAVSPSVAGSPVVLQKLVSGHWKTIAHKASGKRGAYSFSIRATGKPQTWTLRVIRGGTSKARAVVGKTLHVRLTKTKYKVTAATVTKVAAGTPIVITGSVSPKATGSVVLQVLRGGKWANLATAKLVGSKYSFSKKVPPKTYPLRVMKPFSASIATGQSSPAKVTVFAPPVVSPKLSITSPDDAALGLPTSRLVFSTQHGTVPADKAFTFHNTGSGPVTVKDLAIQGTDASNFSFAAGQPTTLVIPAGGVATVTIHFAPSATTNCPVGTAYPDAYRIGNATRTAALVFTSSDPGLPGGNVAIAGLNACNYSGNSEPVLDQVLSTLGYTDVVTGPTTDRRFIGPKANIPGTDEITARYFRAVSPAVPVSLVPLAHYSTTDTKPYHAAGWFAQGATVGPDGTCNASCHQVWNFPAESSSASFLQNQKLLPTPTGTTTFTPTSPFGLYLGEFSNVNFTDDALNIAHQCSPSPADCKHDDVDITPPQYLHDMRVYPAFGPGHVAIPNTYLIAVDVSRLADKNNDFQDVVLLLRNAVPAA
jgi:hypothetical protein